MNDGHTQLEEALSAQLREEAMDVPAPDAMRLRVLAALEDDAQSMRHNRRSFGDWTGRRFFYMAGIAAALLIIAVVAIPSRLGQTVDVVTTDPVNPPTQENTLRLDPDDLRQMLAQTSALEPHGNWAIVSETERVVSLAFVGEPETDSSRVLRIATPPLGTRPDEIVESIRSTLFDTRLVDDSPGSIGGLETRALRLETEAGTTRLGFKVAPDTYIEAPGTDRVFLVHITTDQLQTVVLWVEASPEEIDDFEATVERLVVALVAE